ncbi:MAG TPA: HEAT repeat domain-containing protein [Kofleriaceae bacterium]|nr:HEAT repeat domain-containing protein [Kofleriaceae bacterium]
MTITRAAIRRHLALTSEGGARAELLPLLAQALGTDTPEDAPDRLAAYLCDPLARAVASVRSDAEDAWLRGPLFRPIAARHFAPISDDVAALLCAPMFSSEGRISGALDRWRFSPRADLAIACAVSALDAPAAEAELARLASSPGRDEARLHLALVQAGRALGWTSQAWDRPIATELVDRLLALLDPSSPGPLLHEVGRALGPIAKVAAPLGARVRERAARVLRETIAKIRDPRAGASFLDEVRDLARPRAVPDQDKWASLPARRVVETCAMLLGYGAPQEPARFAPYQDAILADMPELVFGPFLDGLIAGASTAPLGALFEALNAGGPDDRAIALDLAGRTPIDGGAASLLRALEDADGGVRGLAVAAVAWLDGDAATDALARRLDDPEPEVAARAARALVDRGELARVTAVARRGDATTGRGAALALIAGDLGTRTVSTLVNSAIAALDSEHGAELLPDSVMMDVLGDALFGSEAGLATCANLVAAAPAALPVVALVAAHDPDEHGYGFSVPPDGGRELATELFTIVEQGGEAEAQALVILARLFCGDRGLVAPLARALDRTDGWADHIVSAIAELRVRDPAFSRALTPLLADRDHIGARVLAAAAAGRALPVDDPAWSHVDELLSLGSIAGAAAWSALRDRVRFAPP